ncbi:hypothetical protein SAMN02745116_00460 [Pilibacter termitis]|uniref:Haloacid dehalogenase-like hydrolase n=1 Tax=Pilibacter termitis TaxID=263852 RepID=A0A1T4L086_9ENTE|nr:Cof-type HAD-IIB family hydrolase [Pilibacter termitis]SJZ48043.1 hypothetical protein SAMN02745116_00460 [Pilibacter termitis]
MIQLIAIDLDGTLLKNDKTISKENKKVLRLAKEKGVKIVITTGRPLKAIHHILEELNLLDEGDYSITFNGGLVQKNATGEILDKITMSLSSIQEIYQALFSLHLPCDVVSDGEVYQLPSDRISLYEAATPFLNFHKVKPEELQETTIYNKIICATEPDYLDEKAAQLPSVIREKYEVIKSRDILLEFMPKGVTKAYGIAHLAEILGISQSEIMAIGDEENDLSMIEYAGVGVAMANAVPMIQSAADVITRSNEDDGVAHIISQYLEVE